MTQAAMIEPIPPDLLAEPLNWLFAEHYRHRQLCALIDRIGTASLVLAEEIGEAIQFLRIELPLHILDEEEDLFPLLRRRCEPEDDLERTLGLLAADHSRDASEAEELAAVLEAALRTGRPPGGDLAIRRRFSEFAAHERRHIALENAVVLPIARLLLTPEDLGGLARRMAARRGRDRPDPVQAAGAASR